MSMKLFANRPKSCDVEHLRRSTDHQPSAETTAHHPAIALDWLLLLLLLQQLLELLLHASNAGGLVSLLLEGVWFGVVGQTKSP